MQKKLDAGGRPFEIVVILRDGIACTTCPDRRVIRVRENAAHYSDDNTYRCRDCMIREPITQHNEQWRKEVRS